MLYALLVAAVLVATYIFLPGVRSLVNPYFGVAKRDLASILARFEKDISDLRDHAGELLEEAEGHKADAQASTYAANLASANSVKATAVASNLANLIAS